MKKRAYEIDMCNGPLLPKLLLFALPLIASGILQLLFNAADMIIIGQYAETQELAEQGLGAIGATSSMINFFVNVAIGISVGSNVIVARYFGGHRPKDVHDAVHTSVLLSILLGFGIGIIAICFSRPLLIKMDTPPAVLDQAVLYVHIYFAGLPVMMLYNFGSAILRAVGDTKRPLYYLSAAGVLNVILNYCFVQYLHMNVEGVALATVISQALSAFLVLRCLAASDADYKLNLRELKIHPRIVKKILQVGLPAGVQGMIFSISNMLIQSSVNFWPEAIAGNTACMNLEGFVYTSMNAFYQTAISFTSQNLGAGKYKRINRILLSCLLLVTVTGLVMGNTFVYFGRELLGFYAKDGNASIIDYGMNRMRIIMTVYCLCGIMDVLCGAIRGLGYGIMPMVISLIGACGFRVLWIFTFFQANHTLQNLYISYPVSWAITALAHIVCFIIVRRRLPKEDR